MSIERENLTLEAARELWRNPNAGVVDLPSRRVIKAGNIEAIQKAGIESRKIADLAKTYKEPSKIKGYFKRFLIKNF